MASCTAKSDPAKQASYAELIGGRYFNVQLDWNKQIGNVLYAPGKAQPKARGRVQDRRQADQTRGYRRQGVLKEDFCTDIKVPGMVHGRMIRPPVAGAVPVRVDEGSIKDIPGAKVVWRNGVSRRSSPTANGMRSRPRKS